MPAITCFVGRVRPDISLDFPLNLSGLSISEYFGMGSMNNANQPAINIRMDMSRFDSSLMPNSQPTSALLLHNALTRLTHNNPNTRPVNRIGLILADRFMYDRRILGLMFDRGFNPSGMDSVNNVFNNVPREGCAIFLDAIHDIRPIISDFRKEVVFTAIHEIGHIFNLQHIESPKNFLSTSQEEAPYNPGAYRFHPVHRRFLLRANIDDHVLPGGSNYGNTGSYGPTANNPFNSALDGHDLELIISVNQEEFCFFEPIELDVQLLSKVGVYEIKDEIDPGYDSFVIHITRPDGTVFKYRSPRIYCKNFSKLNVSPPTPFLRDISIFGQSGGYTFLEPGEYSIHCVFDTGIGLTLRSNKISINVCAPKLRSVSYIKAEKILTSTKPALFLYHRSGNFNSITIQALEEVWKDRKGTILSTNIQYAIIKYNTYKSKKLTGSQLKKIAQLANNSLDSGRLSLARTKNLLKIKESHGV